MTPPPFGKHQRIAGRILTQLNRELDSQGCQECYALGETDWIVSEDTVVRPDVVVLCGAFPDRYIETAPRMIFEISSESTLLKDSTSKRDLYLQQRVEDYFIVDTKSGGICHFKIDRIEDKYMASELAPVEYRFELHTNCHIHLDFSKIYPKL